jgi:hypothetical protein
MRLQQVEEALIFALSFNFQMSTLAQKSRMQAAGRWRDPAVRRYCAIRVRTLGRWLRRPHNTPRNGGICGGRSA